MKKLLLLLLVISVLFSAIPAVAQPYQVGEHVADFTLPDHANRPVNLYDYQDKIVVLGFWSDG